MGLRWYISVSSVTSALRRPILALLMKNRAICLAITGATILQLSLVASGLPGWRSPVLYVFGIPDPGGGLTRAILALLHGNWQTSFVFHAFAPFFIIALTLIAIASVLPYSPTDEIAGRVEGVEAHSGITAILLMGLVIYWLTC